MNLSVIIPTYNEEEQIAECLQHLKRLDQPDEIIVVDGGSRDQTCGIAEVYARVINSKKGRARQMNEGAQAARGDALLFLHADSRLPDQGIASIQRAIEEGHKGGRFRIRFDDRHFLLKMIEFYTRSHHFSYGDQGFFITRNLFYQLRGYREDVAFEDIDFYRRMKKATKPIILKESMLTSSRRFTEVGVGRQKLINMGLLALYYLGFNIKGLAKRYYVDVRKASESDKKEKSREALPTS